MMGDRHVGLVIEDNPRAIAVLKEYVQSLDHEVLVATTLDEVRATLATTLPCYVVADIQIPHAAGARPHEKAGESAILMVRKLSNGAGRVPVLVVTEYRSDPDYVWRMRDLEADGFVEKSKIEILPDRVLQRLEAAGRADHAACAACNARSLPAGARPSTAPPPAAAARVWSHDAPHGAGVSEEAWANLVERRSELDLFLDFAREREKGFLAGCRGADGVFRDVYLPPLHAAIVAELVEHRGKTIRAGALRCLKDAGVGSAVRLAQQARKTVDVNAVVNGKVSRTRWRAIHTAGEKGALGFRFEPPAGFRWMVGVRGD